MSEPLGLSIGVANLVAARAGSVPVIRSSVLTLFEQRPTEVGLPDENPNLTEPGCCCGGSSSGSATGPRWWRPTAPSTWARR